MFLDHQALELLGFHLALVRITSYNVCYTKLLRSKAGVEEFIDSNETWIKAHITKFSFISPDETEVVLKFDVKDEGYIVERRIFDYELAKTVITSYSIHYTKLYEYQIFPYLNFSKELLSDISST